MGYKPQAETQLTFPAFVGSTSVYYDPIRIKSHGAFCDVWDTKRNSFFFFFVIGNCPSADYRRRSPCLYVAPLSKAERDRWPL